MGGQGKRVFSAAVAHCGTNSNGKQCTALLGVIVVQWLQHYTSRLMHHLQTLSQVTKVKLQSFHLCLHPRHVQALSIPLAGILFQLLLQTMHLL